METSQHSHMDLKSAIVTLTGSIIFMFFLWALIFALPRQFSASETVVVLVVTATPHSAKTLTAIVSPSPSVTPTDTPNATATYTPAAPTATKRRPTATVQPTNTLPPQITLKYPQAVTLIGPLYEGNNPGDRRDERHYPSDSLVFEWSANGALSAGECYKVRVDIKSSADGSSIGDGFIQCDPLDTQKGAAQTAHFTLNKPNGPGPTYAALIPSGGGDLTVTWSVTIVQDEGLSSSGGAVGTDGNRHKVRPLSPTSTQVQFPLKSSS